jgi:hypothetical protein
MKDMDERKSASTIFVTLIRYVKNKMFGLTAKKQGILIIIISGLLFFIMLILNASEESTRFWWDFTNWGWRGHISGITMATWAIISVIGVALGLCRIFVFNDEGEEKNRKKII